MRRQVVSESEADTIALGRSLGATLRPGAVILLSGELGAGKTAFVRGLAAGIGVSEDDVSSPTFTLIQQYRGLLTLHHVDLYRIGGGEVDDLGLEELAESGIVAIEWAEKMPRGVPGAIRVRMEDLGGERRLATIVEPDADDESPVHSDL
jgi:tRNA threonylcarbamoyladenosine biosynthesis protein TsaE